MNLSAEVNRIIRESGIDHGISLIYAGHATGVMAITEYESRLLKDIQEFLNRNIPSKADYHHNGNAFAHLRSMILTPSKVIPVQEGRLALGTWQSVFWVEAERRSRRRKVEVYVIGSQ